jgi:hypothetical protein
VLFVCSAAYAGCRLVFVELPTVDELIELLYHSSATSLLSLSDSNISHSKMPSSSRSDSLKNQKLDNDSFVAFDHAAAGQ